MGSRRVGTRPEGPSVHVGGAWRLVFRDLALDETAILKRAGLPPKLLQGDGSHISVDELYALHEAVEAEAGPSAVALRAGTVWSTELFDPAIFAAICSPNMNVATTRLGEFKRLVGPFSLEVDIAPETTRIRYLCRVRPDLPRTLALSEMAFLVGFARRATREDITPRQVSLPRLPEDLAPYQSFFRCPLVEDSACALTLAARDAELPFLTHNERVWESFEPSLRRRMADARETRSTSEEVEAALLELLPSGRTQMTDVAKELRVGTRTLQRRLAAENTTWLEVLNNTRERLARHYLETTRMSPAEVGFLLGFEDPNSLFRAFQRWTGTTPESWRADPSNS